MLDFKKEIEGRGSKVQSDKVLDMDSKWSLKEFALTNYSRQLQNQVNSRKYT